MPTGKQALEIACTESLRSPHAARLYAHVALERAEREGDYSTATAALSLYVTLGGNFCRAGMS